MTQAKGNLQQTGRPTATAASSASAPHQTGFLHPTGYPYFLQEYGKHVWNVAAGPAITVADVKRAHDLVQLELDESFFRVRIGRATKSELAYLAAMASLGAGPYRSGEIASRLGRPGPESVAPTRPRLIEKGLIYSPSYGLNEFTVPRFDAYMRRSFPLEETKATR